jgi:membrane fusion protein, heavy metal efflux system
MRLLLRRGNRLVEHIEEQPARPGIYISELTIDEPGLWEMSVEFPEQRKASDPEVPDSQVSRPAPGTPKDPNSTENAAVTLPALMVHADAEEAAHSEAPELPEGVHFLKEQQWRIRMKTERVERRRLVERVMFPGQVIARPGGSTRVVAPMTGRIAQTSGASFPQLGDKVEAGQLLAVLELTFSDASARLADVEAELAQATTALAQAHTVFDRVQRLAAEQAKSQRELQEAEAALAMAKSRMTAATALRTTYRRNDAESTTGGTGLPAMELRSPITGILNRIHVGIGEIVSPETTLFQVIDPEIVWLEARIPESSLARLRAADGALFELPDAPGNFIPIKGSMFLGFEVDAGTRTVPLTFELRNVDHALRVGQFVRLHVATARAEETLSLPDSAIVEEAGRPVAFVQVSGETFEMRELVLGIRDGPWVQLLEGVEQGERVVTQGAYVVRLASMASELPEHGHAH